jgi:hypothetical protein
LYKLSWNSLPPNIRNPHTRQTYGGAGAGFMAWCEDHQVTSITAVQPLHAMRCHHKLGTYLLAYIEGTGLAEDSKGPAVSLARSRHRVVDAPA